MAARRRIADLQDKEKVEEVYLCLRKSVPVDRNGRRYLNLILGDRTGQMEALLWEDPERKAERFAALDLVSVSGTVALFQGRLQMHLSDVRHVEREGQPLDEFRQLAQRAPGEMWGELQALLLTVAEPSLRALVQSYLEDGELLARFKLAPAARAIHHAYQSGLLEHTLSVVRLTDRICEHYRSAAPGLLNRDLCLLGAFLHDIGKVWEIGPELGYQYTDEGKLIGHLVLALRDLDRRIDAQPGFPPALADHLRHIILSHHGRLEFGSPKRPKTAEAMVVHRADDLDGQLGNLRAAFALTPPGSWTAYLPAQDRQFFHGWPSGDLPPGEQPPGGGEKK